MEIKPIAYFRSPFSSKFGIPKQAGLVAELEGQIVFEPEFRNPDALRGMEGFDYLWLICGGNMLFWIFGRLGVCHVVPNRFT